MASPVITSVTPSSVALTPGGPPVDVLVVASDPDNASGTGTVTVTDAAGNQTPVTITVVVSDPLAFGDAVLTGLSGVTVTKVASTATSATYRFQA